MVLHVILHVCHGTFPMNTFVFVFNFCFVLGWGVFFVCFTRASLVPCLELRRCHLYSVSYVLQTTRLLPRSGGGDKLSRALGRLKSKTEQNCGYR